MEKKINFLKNRIDSYKTSSNVLKSFKYAFSGLMYLKLPETLKFS